MHHYLPSTVTCSVPIQHISERLPKCFERLFSFHLTGHHCFSPNQHDFYLPRRVFAAYDIACNGARKNMASAQLHFFESLSEQFFLMALYLHRNRSEKLSVLGRGDAPGKRMFAWASSVFALE